jgi:hypothetical protein
MKPVSASINAHQPALQLRTNLTKLPPAALIQNMVMWQPRAGSCECRTESNFLCGKPQERGKLGLCNLMVTESGLEFTVPHHKAWQAFANSRTVLDCSTGHI